MAKGQKYRSNDYKVELVGKLLIITPPYREDAY